jgi:hypothetical protein
VDKKTEEEAYRIATEEAHAKLSKSLNLGEGGDKNHEAAFELLSGAIGGALFKDKDQGRGGGKEVVVGASSVERDGAAGVHGMESQVIGMFRYF